MRKSYIWFVGIAAFFSCNNIEDCQLNPFTDYVAMQTIHDAPVVFDSLVVSEYGRYVEFADSARTLWQLPLDILENEVRMDFYTDSMIYFLEMTYQKEIKIFDPQCDPVTRYYELEVVSHNFDSLVLTNNEVNIQIPINVEVYFN